MYTFFRFSLPTEFCRSEIVRHICYGDEEIALVFLRFLGSEKSVKIVQSFSEKDPPPIFKPSKILPTIYHYYWAVEVFAKHYSLGDFYHYPLNVRQRITFSSVSNKTTAAILKMLANPSLKISKDNQMKLATQLIKLFHENRPLFEWIIADLYSIFDNVPTSKLFSTFNYTGLIFRKSFDDVNFNELHFFFNDNIEVEMFFQFPSIIIDGRPINFYQNSVYKAHPYPDPGTMTEYLSLIHSTFFEEKFYVDLVRDAIKNSKNKNEMVIRASFLQNMQSWTFLSLYPDIIEKYHFYAEEIESVSFICNNIITDLLFRLKNDLKLFNFLKLYTGSFTKSTDFVNVSLPFKLIHNLKGMNASSLIEQIKEPLFCLSDKDRLIDSDFILCYYAMMNVMKALTILHFEELEPIVAEIENCLDKINNKLTRDALTKDIFSLLFIQVGNENNKSFLCKPLSAQALLTILISSCTDNESEILEYLQSGLTQIQLAQQLLDIDKFTLKDILISTKSQLLNALIENNTTVAEHLSKFSKSNKTLFICFKTISSLKNKLDHNNSIQNLDIEEKTIEEIQEISLAIPGQYDLLDKVKEQSPNNEVKELATNLTKNENSYKKPFKLFKILSKQKLEKLFPKIYNFDSNEWEVPSFPSNEIKTVSKTDTVLKLFKGFLLYLDLFIPPLLHDGLSIKDILVKSAGELVDELVMKGDFKRAEVIAEKMNIDIQRNVISSLNYTRKCYERYSENSVPVLATVAVFSKWKDFANETQSPIIRNLILADETKRKLFINYSMYYDDNYKEKTAFASNTKLECNKILKPDHFNTLDEEIEFNDFFFESGFEVTESILSNMIENGNYDQFVNLSFRCKSSDLIEKVIDDHVSDQNLIEFCDLVQQCPVSLLFYQKYKFMRELKLNQDKSTSFEFSLNNIDQIFDKLIENKNYILSSKFYKLFSKYRPSFDHSIMTRLGDSDIGISCISENLKPQIIEHFNQIKLRTLTQIFQQSIPSSWTFHGSIQNTFEENMNDTNSVLLLLNKFNQINCDQVIIKYLSKIILQNVQISSIDKIFKLHQMTLTFLPVIREIANIYKFILSSLVEILLNIKISTNENEMNFNHYFDRIILYIQNNKYMKKIGFFQDNSTIKYKTKIKYLHKFSNQFFFIKFGYYYSLNETEKLIKLCTFHGYHEIAKGLADAFNYDFSEYSYNHYLDQFKLGIFNEEPVYTLSRMKNPYKFTLEAQTYSECNHFLIQKLSSFDKTEINQDIQDILYPSQQKYITDLLQKTMIISSEQKKATLYFLKNFSDIKTAMRVYSTEFDSAFDILENERDFENKKRGFLSLFKAAISSTKFNRFVTSLQKYDSNHNKYGSLLRPLYESLDEQNAPYLTMSVAQIIGDNSKAANVALSIYSKRPQLSLLDFAQSLLLESSNVTPEIRTTLKKIDLQRRFVVFCTEKKLNGFDSLNLFSHYLSFEAIVTLLFKQNEFLLSLEVLEMCDEQNYKTIISKAAFAIANDGFQSVQMFVHNLQNCATEESFEKIMYVFLNRLILSPFNEIEWVSKIANEMIHNELFKAKLQLEYGFIENAANTSISNNFVDLVPLIAKYAFYHSNMNVFLRCMKYLESLPQK